MKKIGLHNVLWETIQVLVVASLFAWGVVAVLRAL